MDDSPLGGFIERLRNDDELRQRVTDAETELAATIKGETSAITQIAADAGFDISGWNNSPRIPGPNTGDLLSPSFCCSLTCCVVSTSTTG
jgi:hypothetical protein